MSAMDLCYPNSGATEVFGANPFLGCFRKLCNNLQNVVAITYIFALQQPTFLVCNFLHFYFTINSQGTIKIQEQDILAIDFQLMSRLISYVPQAINLNTDFSVIDYLSLGRTPHLRLSSRLHDEDYKIIDKYTKELGITDILNIPFNKLSGGQKQLVAISRSLIQDTPIIIMDEPMSALDIGKQVDLLRILVNLTKDGKTIILTSHNPNHALVVESNSCFIKQGEVVAYGYSREVINESLLKAIYGDNITLNPGGKNESVVFNLEAN